MYIYIIVACIVFVYGAFSTIFHSTDMVGNIGRSYGEANLNLFGYLAYIDLLLFLYPLYKLYHNRNLIKKIDFYVGWIILFISLILLQSLLFEFNNVGSVGTTLRLFLLPYIGKAGLWLLWLLTFLVSLVLIFDDIPDIELVKRDIDIFKETTTTYIFKYIDIINRYINNISNRYINLKYIKSLFVKFKNPFFDKHSTEIMATIVSKGIIVEDKPKSNSHTIAHDRLKKITTKRKRTTTPKKKSEKSRTTRKRRVTTKSESKKTTSKNVKKD